MYRPSVLAPPRGKNTTIHRAHQQYEHESKRLNGLKEGAKSLDKNRDILEEQTVSKNREFKRRVDAISVREKRVYDNQRVELDDRQAEHDAFKVEYIYGMLVFLYKYVGVSVVITN